MDGLAKEWSDDKLINKAKLDDPEVMALVATLFRGTIYDIEEEEE